MGIFNKNKGFQSIISAGGDSEYSMFANAISNRNYSLELVYNKVEETITLFEKYEGYTEIEDMKKDLEDVKNELLTINQLMVDTVNSLEQ